VGGLPRADYVAPNYRKRGEQPVGTKLDSQVEAAIIKARSRVSRICAMAALILASYRTVSAIEKFTFIRTADAVVVGQLKLSSYFLLFDGLHVNGGIGATEILFGDGHAGQEFAYHVVIPCQLWWCSYYRAWQHWSETKEMVTHAEIWALVKGSGSSWIPN
jgi:hypothetical protein